MSIRREACLLAFVLALAVPGGVFADAVPLAETTDIMHARYYSPNLGRFLSVDPVGGTIGSSQSWNRYSYVLNNPIRHIDPTGAATEEMWNNFYDRGQQRVMDAPAGPQRDQALADYKASIRLNFAMGIAATLGKFGVLGALSGGSDSSEDLPNRESDLPASEDKGLGANPFEGKSPEELDQMFNDKGFESRGPDPKGGKGGYVNPETGRSYHIDPGGEYKKGKEESHIDVNRVKGKPGSDLPKKKYPIEPIED